MLSGSILRFGESAALRRHAVGLARHDQPVQGFGLPSVRHQFGREPVEQLGVARRLAAAAEVVGRLHQRPAEVPGPDVVDRHARRQRIVLAGDPVRQRRPPAAAGLRVDAAKAACRSSRVVSSALRAASSFVLRFGQVPSPQRRVAGIFPFFGRGERDLRLSEHTMRAQSNGVRFRSALLAASADALRDRPVCRGTSTSSAAIRAFERGQVRPRARYLRLGHAHRRARRPALHRLRRVTPSRALAIAPRACRSPLAARTTFRPGYHDSRRQLHRLRPANYRRRTPRARRAAPAGGPSTMLRSSPPV